jgi:pteridine reductase
MQLHKRRRLSKQMKGETVLITGASRRLGRAIALALSAQGMNIIVHYHQSDYHALSLVHGLVASGGKAWPVQADLSNESGLQKLLEQSIEQSGEIHHLINNASIFPEDTLDSVSKESLEANVTLHARAPQFLGQGLYNLGNLKTVTNLLDTRVVDYDQQHVSYHLSKRMLMSLNSIMALEWSPKVRVNAVAPGLVLPPEGQGQEYLAERAHTNPLQSIGSEEDITGAVVFLLQSPFITGQIIYVDGGRHLKGRVYE